ncbi:IS1634 family transposase, partial [Acidithiobacillus ferrivorans]|nr:IS1634 family transposase [Acidithiobacillus ferrivorans]
MHVKITTSGSRRYVQLVESYRDDDGKVKKRTVATLGRLDQVDSQLNAVIQGLIKVSGQVPTPTPMISSPSIAFEAARAFGDVWALTELWKELGFSALRQVFRKTRHTTDVEA